MISVLVFIVTVILGFAAFCVVGYCLGLIVGLILAPIIIVGMKLRDATARLAWLAGYAWGALLYRSHQFRTVSRRPAYPGTEPAKPSSPPPV